MRPVAISIGILGAAALGALVPWPSSTPAIAPLTCPGTSAPLAVEATPAFPTEVPLDNTLDRRELKTMATTGTHAEEGVVHGLTIISGSHSIEIVLNLTQRPDGLCSSVDKVTVALVATKAISYVERRYRPGSCPYRETAAHEARHVANYRDRQLEAASAIAKALREKVPVMVAPKMAGGLVEARAWWLGRVGEIVGAEADVMTARVHAGDLEVDSETSKQATFALCSGDW
jgi:hypothetical protein